MTARQQFQTLLLMFLALMVATGASAQGKTEFDDFIVYHSAIPSTFISAEMGEEYDLVRSRSMGPQRFRTCPQSRRKGGTGRGRGPH